MQRRFKQDIGRFKKGELRDYAQGVWQHLARSAKVPLDKLSELVDNQPAQSFRKENRA